MRRLAIRPTLSSRLLRVAFVLGAALLLAALAAAPASAHAEKKAGRYSFVVGFGDEPAYAGQSNSLQVIVSQDGKPATDLADEMGKLKAHLYYGGKVDPSAEMVELPLEPHFGDGWGTPGDYRSFFVPSQPGSYTVHLQGRLGAQKVNLVIPSGPDTFGDVNDAATAAQRAAEDTASQARLLALGGILIGIVGLVVGALAWGRRTAAPAARPDPDVALTGAGKV
jgi:hypothetical protein